MMLFDKEDRENILEILWFWVRDFKNKGGRGDFDQTNEQYLCFKHQLENGFTTDTPGIDPVLKDLLEKCDLFMTMDISFQDGDDFRQRNDFRAWVISKTGVPVPAGVGTGPDYMSNYKLKELQSIYKPFDEGTDELYWQAYEFALLKKFY